MEKYDRDVHYKDRMIAKALKAIEKELAIAFEKGIIKRHFEYVYAIGYEHGRRSRSHEKPVLQYKNGVFVFRYPSITITANSLNTSKQSISRAIAKGVEHKGSTFEFEDKKRAR